MHIETRDLSIIIDTGPDFRQQVLRENILKLDAVLYTHQHKDHIAGLDDVRSYNFVQKKPMPLYGSHKTLNRIAHDFNYAFEAKKYPGVPQLTLNEIENEAFKVEELDILPIDVLHYQMQVYGYRIGNFTYITDANYIADKEKEKALNSEVLVVNALFRENHYSHFSLQQAIDLVHELKPQKAFFTHISHKMGLHEEVAKELPQDIALAYDGLKVEVSGA